MRSPVLAEILDDTHVVTTREGAVAAHPLLGRAGIVRKCATQRHKDRLRIQGTYKDARLRSTAILRWQREVVPTCAAIGAGLKNQLPGGSAVWRKPIDHLRVAESKSRNVIALFRYGSRRQCRRHRCSA